MFRARLPSIFSTHLTKCHACHGNLHLVTTWRHKTRLNLPRKIQSAAPATRTGTHLLKTMQKYCACHTKRLSTRYKTRLNVTKCHACHAKRSYATLETSKSDPFCRTYHRHGHTALTRMVANGCERLRNINATSREHTLNPQTPRVKREPLLRIREKSTQRPQRNANTNAWPSTSILEGTSWKNIKQNKTKHVCYCR